MLRNYFRIAIRHFIRHRLFTSIKILCLAIGLTFSMLISDYIFIKENVNSNLKNVNNQYLIKSKWKEEGIGIDITACGPLAKAVKDEYPGLVENYYRYSPATNVVFAGDKYFQENINIGDTTFVRMYGFPLLYGNKDKAFTNNNSAVITETMAMKLFGTKNAIGKTIGIQTTVAGVSQDYIVSAVLKDIPFNSVINLLGVKYGGSNYGISVFIPAKGSHYVKDFELIDNWKDFNTVEFIELKPGITPKDMEQPFHQLVQKYYPPNAVKMLRIELAPVKNYYIKSNEDGIRGIIKALSLVAIFLLLTAIINFVNITVGTSSYRLKEIGLRKVFGGSKRQLIYQFITEAFLTILLAAFLSVIFYELLRPAFNNIMEIKLDSFLNFDLNKIILFVCLILGVGILSGIYPAFILSASKVIHSVKGKINSSKGGLQLRKILLTVQFTLTIIIFICTFIIFKQVSFLFKKDLGYNKNQVLSLTTFPKQWDSLGVQKMLNIRNTLAAQSYIKDASLTFEIPDRDPIGTLDLVPENTSNTKPQLVYSIAVDENYGKVLNIPVLQGSFFSQSQSSFHPNEIVLNETALKAFGWTDGVGKKLKYGNTTYTIAGVVKDFNYSSLRKSVIPMAFLHVKDELSYRYLMIKLNTTDIPKALMQLKQEWKKLSPYAPFEYTFLDDTFKAIYQPELQLKKAGIVATLLNLFIVLIGLYGVVAFTLVRRNKEIAIRKVMGSDVKNILWLFIRNYLLMILLACFIAWPLAYLITNKWLEGYAYRIHQNLMPYLSGLIFIFLLVSILISLQCLKLATANPVKSLRTE